MINKIKIYFSQKRQIRELLLDTIKKANDISYALSDLADWAINAVESSNSKDNKSEK